MCGQFGTILPCSAGRNEKGGQYAWLRDKAETLYPESRVIGQWSAQDCMTLDGIPYIGRFSARKPDWYVALDFQYFRPLIYRYFLGYGGQEFQRIKSGLFVNLHHPRYRKRQFTFLFKHGIDAD